MTGFSLARRLVAEFVGTAFLLATVVGSGIMGERLADGNMALALLGNTIAAGYWFTSSTSFANPAVTVARSFTDTFSGIDPAHGAAFIAAQVAGAAAATMLFRWLLADNPAPAEND